MEQTGHLQVEQTATRWGVLVISHGSRNPDWVLTVDESVCKLNLPAPLPLDSSFLEAVDGRGIQDGIRNLEAQGVTDLVVVPLFVSSASTHMDEISYALGLQAEPTIETEIERMALQARVHFCAPIDDDPLIAQICYEKIRELSVAPAREVLLMVGHGSDEEGFGDRWSDMLWRMAKQVQQLGRFDQMGLAMLHPDEIAEKVAWWERHFPEHAIIVAPLFLSEGYFTKKVIPQRLAGGRNIRYNGKALLPHDNITRWMERQIAKHF